jgi:hypothetical protein
MGKIPAAAISVPRRVGTGRDAVKQPLLSKTSSILQLQGTDNPCESESGFSKWRVEPKWNRKKAMQSQ